MMVIRYHLILLIILTNIYLINSRTHTAYNQLDDGLSSHNTDWMSTLKDSTKISAVSLPGTHETMTDDNDGVLVDCQAVNLQNQLNAGVRAIDLRLKPVNNGLHLFHGDYYLSATLTDVLRTIKSFLNSHPNEFILMRIDRNNKSEDIDNFNYYKDTFLNTYFNTNSWPFYKTGSGVPTVGDVRGKIVVVATWSQSGILNWNDNNLFNIQDYWDLDTISDLYNKWTKVKNQLNNANTHQSNSKFYINFLSGTNSWGQVHPYFVASGFWNNAHNSEYLSTGCTTSRVVTPWCDPDKWPDFRRVWCANTCIFGCRVCSIVYTGTNILSYDHMWNANLDFVGIIFADFPGQGLIDRIITKNEFWDNSFVVLSIDHAFGSSVEGKYFNFDISTVDDILGRTTWDRENFYVYNHRTNQESKVILWRGRNGGSVGDGHGRKNDGTARSGDWRTDDIIELQVFMVLSIDHASGSSEGKYFNFDISVVDDLLGRTNWNAENFYVKNHRTNQVSKVILWRSRNGGSIGDGHGRKNDGTAGSGDWRTRDVVHFVCPSLNTDAGNKGRCGPLFGDVRCNQNLVSYAVYCNSENGWCGTTGTHRAIQATDIYDFKPTSCVSQSQPFDVNYYDYDDGHDKYTLFMNTWRVYLVPLLFILVSLNVFCFCYYFCKRCKDKVTDNTIKYKSGRCRSESDTEQYE